MKETIKKAFLGGIVFLGTVITGFIGFAAWSDLPTQTNNATLTADIWNQMITKINTLGAQVDSISSLGVNQTRQQFTSPARVAGTTYTNNTGKPILLAATVTSNGTYFDANVNIYVDGILIINNGPNSGATGLGGIYGSSTIIIPNGSTYKVTVGSYGTSLKWFELR